MKRSLKQQWLAALRSGTYKQARAQLRNGDAHCCLGVLCDIDPKLKAEVDSYFYEDHHGWEEGYPPESISDEVGLSAYHPIPEKPDYAPKNKQEALVIMNDSGASFAEIADWIEQHIPEEPDEA